MTPEQAERLIHEIHRVDFTLMLIMLALSAMVGVMIARNK